jgi:hypothetical protein
MKTYLIYKHPNLPTKAVAKGYKYIYLIAFILPIISTIIMMYWSGIRKQTWLFLGIVIVAALLDFVGKGLEYESVEHLIITGINLVILLGMFIAPVIYANKWIVDELENQGYKFTIEVKARNWQTALASTET